MDAKILVPVRYAAWLSGDLGRQIEIVLRHSLGHVPAARVQRLPRGFLIEADEDAGPFLEEVHHAVQELQAQVQKRYPVFSDEMGPLWTGTLQVVFPD